jgi:aerobic-type carbon monoxide dehydrogenase small subunit (CoxS/CutS family)
MAIQAFTFVVNGEERGCKVDEDKPMLWVLRENLELTGTKYGCGIAACGACTVLIEEGDGLVPVRSCMLRAGDVRGRPIRTIERLTGDGVLVQQAWIEADVPQCGYCQSGQLMQAAALLAKNPNPSDADIVTAMSGNICRCATYPRIKRAIKRAAQGV